MVRAQRLITLVVLAAVALAGCTVEPPPSPIAAIPRLLVDFTNNTTVLYLSSSIGADVRYGNLTIVLHNDNVTENATFHAENRFVLVANSSLTFFTVRASADESNTFYYYNATMNIVKRAGPPSSQASEYQIFIRETTDGPIQQAAVPYKHILEEGRR